MFVKVLSIFASMSTLFCFTSLVLLQMKNNSLLARLPPFQSPQLVQNQNDLSLRDVALLEPLQRLKRFIDQQQNTVRASQFIHPKDVRAPVHTAPENMDPRNQKDLSSQEKRFPKAIIIGVKKSGTRALLEYLRLHPDIKAPGPEVHYFDRYFDRGPNWYRRQMPLTSPEQLTIEKTPSYFVHKEVPARVAAMDPNIKLVVVVRNPVTRALSDYSQNAAKRENFGTFESHAFTNVSSGEVNSHWGAIRIGIYWRYLKRWLNYFPLKNIHFVHGERLITHPAQEVRKVEQFLGLTPVIDSSHFLFNATKGFPCLLKKPPRTPDGDSTNRTIVPHCLGKTKGRVHPQVSDFLLEQLREFYRPHNDLFYKMSGRNFKWDH